MKRTAATAATVLALATPALAELPGTSAELAALYDALRAPRVLGSVPTPPKLVIGHAEVRPGAGTRTIVLGAAGEPCGVVLDGPATLVYRIEDRFSIPVARRNLKQADRVKVAESGGALTVTAELDGAAVWGWDLELGAEPDGAAASPVLPDWLRRILEDKLSDNPERDLLISKVNGESGYRWALFHGAGDEFVLDHDPRPFARAEVLTRMDRIVSGAGDFSRKLQEEELAAQPLGRSWLDLPSDRFVAEDAEIRVCNPAGDRVEVSATTRFRALDRGLRLLPLTLWSETYDDALRRQPYEISALKVNGAPGQYLHREGSLLVLLPAPMTPSQTVEVETAVAGEVLERPAGDSFWRLLGSWYPRPGQGGLERAEFRIDAEVAPPFVPFAGGEVLERSGQRIRTRLAAPMEMATVVAGRYAIFTEEHQGSRVHVASYASVKPKSAQQVARIILAARGCLEKWLDVPYPFQDLQVIEVNQWGWGQAPPGIIFITQEAFLNQARARVNQEETGIVTAVSRGINERIAHEVAHSWFPHVAKIASFSEENWLSESLAEYASAYCISESMGEREGRFHFERQLRDWKRWSKDAGDDASVRLAEHLANREQDSRDRFYLLYGRGPLVLHAVREKLQQQRGEKEGDRLFLIWLRSYVANFRFKTAGTRHLIGILSQITGEDWMPFFEQYLLGTGHPPVR